MLLFFAFLALLLPTCKPLTCSFFNMIDGIDCPLNFNDSYCASCDSSLTQCLTCVDSTAFEESTGLCHTYSKAFQQNGESTIFNNAYYNATKKRVQMLDPFCKVKDIPSLASSNSTICGSCAKFKDGSNAQRYVSEDSRECHSTCSYGPNGRYPSTNNKCASCTTNCFKCSNSTNCEECSYTKKRFSGTVTPANFLSKIANAQINPVTDCTQDRNSKFIYNYYVTPASSHATYWTDLNDVFYDVYSQIGDYASAEINIYLLKSGSNLVHYLLDNNPSGGSRLNSGGSYNLRNGDPFIPRLSDRTQADIKISPRYCSDDTTPIEGCLSANEKPIIKWKSEVSHIFVTRTVTLKNVILDGADMILSLVSTDTSQGVTAKACRDSKQECCTGPLFSGYGCSPTNMKYDNWTLQDTQESTGIARKYGIFVFQYIRDASNLYIPELLIENCEIKNFLYSKYHTSFVQFDIYGGKLTIKNSSFDRFFFPHGLISNSHLLVDRNYDPMTSSFTQITCRKINSTYQGDCYSILLENSTFTNYNPLKTSIASIAYKNVIEGSVITLHNFDGPITVNNCTFQNMLSFSPLGQIGQNSGVCNSFDFENSAGFANFLQASHNIITTSKYKLFFDKHFRKYYQAPDTQNLPTTAVIHLRNVTKGLVVHNSTFDKISSVAGGSIFIHGFNNTYSSPILITNNQFTNNFAQLIALNILIYKEEPDVPSLNCTGIMISNNQFLNNYGCFNTLANVAIACENTITSSVLGFGDKTFDQYYTGYSAAVSDEHTETTAAKKNFVRYMEDIVTSTSNPYIHPFNSSISFNPNSVTVSNNLLSKNYAILSNGFYCQGIMDLIIENNILKQNSIIISTSYSNSDFTLNVLSINSITPNSPSSSSNIMKESCPIVIRYCNRINIRGNVFDGNSQGFRGGDYHIAQAITLASIIGRESVLIENCTFTNYRGLSSSINYNIGLYDYASTAMITFNYWESLVVQSTNVTENLFTIMNCSFTNSKHSNDQQGRADTKNIYYVPSSAQYIAGLSSLYSFPFAYFLKYFFEGEMTGIFITPEQRTVASVDPTTLQSYFKKAVVSVQKANVVNNTIDHGTCGFSNFFFQQFEVKDSNFSNNKIEELSAMGQCAALICAFGNQIFNDWGYRPQILLSHLAFQNNAGIEMYSERFNYYMDPASTNLSPFYRYVAQDITSINAYTTIYAPLFTWKAYFFSFTRVTYENCSSPMGFATFWYSQHIEFWDAKGVNNSRPQGVGLMYLSGSPNIFINIQTYNNVGVTSYKNFDNIMPLIKVEDCGNVTVRNSSFHDMSFPCVFAVNSGSSLRIENSNFSDFNLTRVLSWTTSSSEIYFQQCQFENITFSSEALAGIALTESSTFSLSKSEISSLTGPNSLVLVANLSDSTIQDTVVQNCTTSGPNGLMTTVLGNLLMDHTNFLKNTGQDQGMFYAILMTSFQISNCLFDSNAARTIHKLFDLTQLLNGAVFTSCEFIDSSNDFTIETYHYDSNFINVFDADLLLNNCTFVGGISAKGAISLLAEDFTLTVNDSEFHNNIGFVGSIGGMASLAIENTIFYGNTHTIVMTGGNTAEFKNVTFQEEKSLSVSFENVNTIKFDQVTFDGLPNPLLKRQGLVYSEMESKSQGAQITSGMQTEIKSSKFKNLRYVNESICGGGLYIYTPEAAFPLESNLSISDSSFENITSFAGGAICIKDMAKNRLAANIEDTIINSCVAQTGGAIFYHSFDDPNRAEFPDYLRISGATRITNNKAGNQTSGSGGGIYYQGRRPEVESSVLINGNTAHYGPNWASFPVMVHIINNPGPDILKAINITENTRILESNSNDRRTLEQDDNIYLVSGIIPNPPPIVALYDIDNQLVWGWDQGTLKMSVTTSSVVRETPTTFYATNGYFALYPLQLINTPGTSVGMTLSTSITIQSGSQAKIIPISLASTMYFRQCVRGERLTDARECYACPADQYILDPEFRGTCYSCPNHLQCKGGGDIGPEPDYWRFDGWKSSALACLNGEACIGASLNATNDTHAVSCKEEKNSTFCYTGFCHEGYEGNLCSSCSNGYAKSSTFCVPCRNNPVMYVVLVIAILVAIFVLAFTVRNALKLKEATKINKPKTSILIKIFLNYIQLVSIVGSFQFQWPSQAKTMFNIQTVVASGPTEALSLDCLFPSQTDSSRIFFQKLLFVSLSPLAVIVIGTLVWAVIFIVTKTRFNSALFKANIITTYVVIIFIFHSSLVQTSLSAFRCQNIGDDDNEEYYVERDLDVKCWSSVHLFWAFVCALPAFIIWGIGTPILAFVLLKKNLNRLDDVDFKSKYGFLYTGYKKEKYYWEFVIMYRKIAMIVISVYMVTLGVKFQALCVLGVCFISFVLHIYGLPFEDQNLNNMERRALVIATITLYIGIFYVTGEIPAVADWIFLIIILGLNVFFFISWLRALVLEFIKERKAQKELQKHPTQELQVKPLLIETPSIASPLSRSKGVLLLSEVVSLMEEQPMSPIETFIKQSPFTSSSKKRAAKEETDET